MRYPAAAIVFVGGLLLSAGCNNVADPGPAASTDDHTTAAAPAAPANADQRATSIEEPSASATATSESPRSRFEAELEDNLAAGGSQAAAEGSLPQDPANFLLQPPAEELTPEQRHQRFEEGLLKGDLESAMTSLFPDRSELVKPESAFEMLTHAREVFNKHNQPEELKPILVNFLFSASAAHAMKQELDESMGLLTEAVGKGFEGLDYLYMIPYFEPLTTNPKYAPVIEGWLREQAVVEVANFESFPFDFELATPDGQSVKLADFHGKPVIVDVWGTWCPPCKKEIPHFIELKTKYADKLGLVGINYERVDDDEQAKQQISEFTAENNVNYPCVIGDEATMQKIPEFEGFPTTLFIDATGKVRLKAVGYHPLPKLEAILQAIADSTKAG